MYAMMLPVFIMDVLLRPPGISEVLDAAPITVLGPTWGCPGSAVLDTGSSEKTMPPAVDTQVSHCRED